METITVSFVKDGDGYVSHCLDYDIVSQGDSRQEAEDNIIEAVIGFLEIASAEEIQRRLEWRGRVKRLRIGSA